MCGKIAVCADAAALADPSRLGLGEERLLSQSWIVPFSSGDGIRSFLSSGADVGEAWVFSSDDVDPINVAAALKSDRPTLPVYLVSFECGGSLKSRAQAARLDGVLDRAQFASRYSFRKCSAARSPAAGRDVSIPRAPSPAEGGASCAQATEPLPSAGLAIAMESKFLQGMDLGALSKGAAKRQEDPRHAAGPLEGRSVQPGNAACVIAVASASGGSGKSTLAALVAVFAAGMGFKTLLLDGDLQFGDVHLMVGEKDPCRIDEVSSGARPMPVPREDGAPAVLAAPERLETSEAVASRMPEIIDAACGSFEVVVVNTGSLWAEQHASVFERASSVLMLVSQSASSLEATKRAVAMLGRCGIPTSPLRFVLNGCKRGAPLSSIDVSCSLKGSPVHELRDGGRDVDELMAAGLAVELVDDENPLCVSVESLLDELLPARDDGGSRARSGDGGDRPRRGRLSRLKRRVSCLC